MDDALIGFGVGEGDAVEDDVAGEPGLAARAVPFLDVGRVDEFLDARVALAAGEPRLAQADDHLHGRKNHGQTGNEGDECADGHLPVDGEDRAAGDDQSGDGLRAHIGERAENRADPRLVHAAAGEVSARAVEQQLCLFFLAEAAHEPERGNESARGAGEFFLSEAGFVVGALEF